MGTNEPNLLKHLGMSWLGNGTKQRPQHNTLILKTVNSIFNKASLTDKIDPYYSNMTIATTKKEIFMAETLKLIYSKGFKATSLRDIAKNANFEVPNVYNYIDSKEAFLEGYLFSILNSFHGCMDDIMASSYSPKDKLKFVVSRHIEFTIEKPYQVALFVYDWRNLTEPGLSKFKELRKEYLLKFGSIIARGIKEGQFRPMDVEMATFLVFSSLRGLFNIIIHEGDERKINPIELNKQITDFIFGGIDKTCQTSLSR